MSFSPGVEGRIGQSADNSIIDRGVDYIDGKLGMDKRDYEPEYRINPDYQGENFGHKGENAYTLVEDKVVEESEDYIGEKAGQFEDKPSHFIAHHTETFDFGQHEHSKLCKSPGKDKVEKKVEKTFGMNQTGQPFQY